MGIRDETYDVIVAGGGISGTMAAAAAAREGRKVLLVERYTALGGMGTLGLVQPITMWGIRGQYVIGGTGKVFLENLGESHEDASTGMSHYGPACDAEHLKYALERMALRHGVSLLYHSWVSGVEMEGDRLSGLELLSKDGSSRVQGHVFVDATGDADVSASAGVPFDLGSQGASLMLLVAGIERERCPERPEISKIYGRHRVGYGGLAVFWHPRSELAYFNVTEVEGVDTLDPEDLTAATIACRKQAWDVLDVVRTHVPGFESAYISQIAPALGVRESRRIRGRYLLDLEDVDSGRHFDDVVARASCPIDIHGSDHSGRGEYRGLKHSYAIPYRCLVTDEVPNLIVTGRCISADHAAHSSLRRMAPGFALGEAAGMAASLAKDTGDVRDVVVADLQDKLRRYGAVLDPEKDAG